MESVAAGVASIFSFKAVNSNEVQIFSDPTDVTDLDDFSQTPSTRVLRRLRRPQPPVPERPALTMTVSSKPSRPPWRAGCIAPVTQRALEEHNRAAGLPAAAWSMSDLSQATPGGNLVQFITRCRAVAKGAEQARTRLTTGDVLEDAVQRVMDFVGGPAPSECGSAATIDPDDAPNGSVVRGRQVLHVFPMYGGRQGHIVSDNLTVSTPRRTLTRMSGMSSGQGDGFGAESGWAEVTWSVSVSEMDGMLDTVRG